MSHTPLVSVVVPAFNQEKYIARCIRSLINQDFPQELYQIIVVDDGSTDNTSRVIAPFKDKIHVISNKTNIGLPASLNKALRSVTTPFVVRVDSDDYVNDKFLLFLQVFLQKNHDIDAIACDYLLVDAAEQVIARKNCMQEPIACGIMFRLDQLIDINLYDESFLIHEERDLRMRFCEKYKINRLQLPLYRYRQHSSNMTKNKQASDQHYEKLVKKHGKKVEEGT